MESPITVINQKSSKHISYNGREYHHNRKYESSIHGEVHYWVCSNRFGPQIPNSKKRIQVCYSRLTTIVINGQHVLKTPPSDHGTCDANAIAQGEKSMKRQLREKAKQNRDLPCRIIQEFKAGLIEDKFELLPQDSAMRRTIQR
jgi:hypothetical protein